METWINLTGFDLRNVVTNSVTNFLYFHFFFFFFFFFLRLLVKWECEVRLEVFFLEHSNCGTRAVCSCDRQRCVARILFSSWRHMRLLHRSTPCDRFHWVSYSWPLLYLIKSLGHWDWDRTFLKICVSCWHGYLVLLAKHKSELSSEGGWDGQGI
jgi:hypothetical protein